jgi:hypothetical protein
MESVIIVLASEFCFVLFSVARHKSADKYLHPVGMVRRSRYLGAHSVEPFRRATSPSAKRPNITKS